MLPASLILQAFRETGRTAPSVGRVDPRGDHTEALGLLLHLLSLSHLHSGPPFLVHGCCCLGSRLPRIQRILSLWGDTPNLSLSRTSLPEPQCPFSKHALLLSFQRIPWHLQFLTSQKEPPSFLQTPVPLPCPLAFLWSFLFFLKSRSFTAPPMPTPKHKGARLVYSVPFQVPKVHSSIDLINTDLEEMHFAKKLFENRKKAKDYSPLIFITIITLQKILYQWQCTIFVYNVAI